MAEIKLEKKKTPFWPWLLAILAVAVIVWYVVENDDVEMETASTDTTETVTSENNQNTEDFVTYVNNNIDQVDMGRDHEFTSQGINLLADKLEDMAEEYDNITLNEKVDSLNTKADEITNDPASTAHADKIKSAFTTAADIIKDIQKEANPENEQIAADIEEKADAINSGEETLNQKEEIKSFFRAAADAIDEMSNRNL